VDSKKRVHYISAAILLIVLAALLLYNRETVSRLFTGKQDAESPSGIERRIRSILELPTYEHVYHNVIYIGEEARFLGIKHLDKRLLFSIDVTVKAGINLQKGISVTRTSTGALRVGLPPPEILMVDADESSIREYFAKEFGGKISRLEYYDEIDESKRRTVEDAVDREILDISGEYAKTMVENLLDSLVAGQSYVYFEPQGEQQ